jgi:uncharacterized protein YyaL (SSP411 family)
MASRLPPLMVDARAGAVLPEPKYLIAAERAAEFILEHMCRPDGRLLHTWRGGQAKLDGYLDDYAYLINAFVTLYEATFNERWIDHAVRLADILLDHFEDKKRGGFFLTADDHERLIARNKDLHDASVPAARHGTALLRSRQAGRQCGFPNPPAGRSSPPSRSWTLATVVGKC